MRKIFLLDVLFMVVISSFFFSSCENNAESNSLFVEDFDSSMVNVDIKKDISNIASKYHVDLLDATKFAKAFNQKEEFEIIPYCIKNDTLMYIVNFKDKWIILSGDKRLNPIAAEGKDGKISLRTENENFLTWLNCFAEDVRAISQDPKEIDNEYTKLWNRLSPKKTNTIASTKSSPECKWAVVYNMQYDNDYTEYGTVIDHLIATKWGQRSPWNTKLPIDVRYNKKCPTGCVAVAAAQILYYLHYFLGKPNGLYHNISVSATSISSNTTNIGFSHSNYVSNSSRWNDMALSASTASTAGDSTYVGDLMLEIGKLVNMSYAGDGSGANMVASNLNPFNITFSNSNYNYQLVKNDLQNSKPVNITARGYDSTETFGHSWIIDGIGKITRRIVYTMHFEYTENWMNEAESYDSFDDIRYLYDVESEYDIITSEAYYDTEYLFMNWGYNGDLDSGYYGSFPSDIWSGGGMTINSNKKINYNFR